MRRYRTRAGLLMAATLSFAAGCSGDDAAANVPIDASGSPVDAAIQSDAGGAVSEAGPSATCSPGTVLDPFGCETDPFCRCLNYAADAGTLVLDRSFDAVMSITSFMLPQPMKSGEPFSLSADVTNEGYTGTIEFWGTTSECGPGLQKLFSAPVASKVFCADVMPAQDFARVLVVEHLMFNGGSAHEVTNNVLACPTSRCPTTR